jgi:hypothetical protein
MTRKTPFRAAHGGWVLAVTLALAGHSEGVPSRPGPEEPVVEAESSDFQRLAEGARAAHGAGKLDQARELYEKALALDPDWTDGRFSLGTVLYGLDLHEDARAAFRRVVAEQPDSGPALAFEGLCEFERGRLEEALRDLQRARALGLGGGSELESVAGYHTAILLTRFGQFELAYEVFEDFVKREKDSPSLIEALGLAVLRLPYLPSEAPVEKRELIRMAGRAISWPGPASLPARGAPWRSWWTATPKSPTFATSGPPTSSRTTRSRRLPSSAGSSAWTRATSRPDSRSPSS